MITKDEIPGEWTHHEKSGERGLDQSKMSISVSLHFPRQAEVFLSRCCFWCPFNQQVRFISAKAERPNHPSCEGGGQLARGGSQPARGGGPPHQRQRRDSIRPKANFKRFKKIIAYQDEGSGSSSTDHLPGHSAAKQSICKIHSELLYVTPCLHQCKLRGFRGEFTLHEERNSFGLPSSRVCWFGRRTSQLLWALQVASRVPAGTSP